MGYLERTEVTALLGKVITRIDGMHAESEEVLFECETGEIYKMFHEQDCCESVTLNEVIGIPENLLHSPITMAEEIIQTKSYGEEPAVDDYIASYTWTFYKLATLKGYVTLRWYGLSNGYYSESVDFEKVKKCSWEG